MKKLLVICLLCLPAFSYAENASDSLKSLIAVSEPCLVPNTAVPAPTDTIRQYRRELTSEDMDNYLQGLSVQTTDVSAQKEIARLIFAGSYAEKMKYLVENSKGKTLITVSQTVKLNQSKTICTWVTKTVCVIACSLNGCYDDCKDILVDACPKPKEE